MTEIKNPNALLMEYLLSNIPQYIFWKDTKSRYLGCNINFALAVGLSNSSDIIGKTDHELPWGNEYADVYKEEDKFVLAGQKIVDKEAHIVFSDGIERVILVNKAPLISPENHQIIAIIGIFNDITALKKNQSMLEKATLAAQAANAIKTEFIQNMQHDLRTPTSGSVSILADLAEHEKDAEKREKLVLLYNAAKKVHDICNEIIDFENISQDKEAVLLKKFSIHYLVRGVIDLNQPAALARGLSLRFIIEPNVPAVVKGDPKRVSRILINLTGNAIKFTKKGDVTIRAKVIKKNEQDAVIQFSIEDTGIGIPPDKKNMIYEQFIRLNPSNEGYFKGSGLGLNIVKKYVEDLKGEIDVHSEVGKGTTFYVTLLFKTPLVDEIYDEDAINSQGAELLDHKVLQNSKQKSLTRPTQVVISDKNAIIEPHILLIEDDALARIATMGVLYTTNCKITIAENVAGAKNLVNAISFDLVISDLGLPDGSGEDIVAMVKAAPNCLNYNTPFVALTAHSDQAKKVKAERAGFLLVMSKPLLKEKVPFLIDNYVYKRVASETEQENNELGELSIIDFDSSKKLVNGNEGLAFELLEMLASDLPKEILLIQDSYDKNDIENLRALLHKLKGSFCYCGVPRLQKTRNELSVAVKQVTELSEIKHFFDYLYKEVNIFIDEYQRFKR